VRNPKCKAREHDRRILDLQDVGVEIRGGAAFAAGRRLGQYRRMLGTAAGRSGEAREIEAMLPGALDRKLVAGIGVTHDAASWIVPQHPRDAL
jgi:hypothetical protein